MNRFLIVVVAASLATVACSKDQSVLSSAGTMPTAVSPSTTKSAEDIRAAYEQHKGDLATSSLGATLHPTLFTPPTRSPQPRPSYNAVYQDCMVIMVAWNITEGTPNADPSCDGIARQNSGTSRPLWNEPRRAYYDCLNVFSIRGSRGAGDFIGICNGPDAAIPPD